MGYKAKLYKRDSKYITTIEHIVYLIASHFNLNYYSTIYNFVVNRLHAGGMMAGN